MHVGNNAVEIICQHRRVALPKRGVVKARVPTERTSPFNVTIFFTVAIAPIIHPTIRVTYWAIMALNAMTRRVDQILILSVLCPLSMAGRAFCGATTCASLVWHINTTFEESTRPILILRRIQGPSAEVVGWIIPATPAAEIT